jgi:hypothetical protein
VVRVTTPVFVFTIAEDVEKLLSGALPPAPDPVEVPVEAEVEPPPPADAVTVGAALIVSACAASAV